MSRGWQIAAIALAVTTVLSLGWGYANSQRLSDQAASADGKVAELEARVNTLKTEYLALSEQEKQELADAKQQYKSVKKKLKVSEANLQQSADRLKSLENDYQKEKAEAQKANASQKEKTEAAQAEAALAKHCAAVMATGLHVIYAETNPNRILDEVSVVMAQASSVCSKVVKVQ